MAKHNAASHLKANRAATAESLTETINTDRSSNVFKVKLVKLSRRAARTVFAQTWVFDTFWYNPQNNHLKNNFLFLDLVAFKKKKNLSKKQTGELH